MLGALQKRGWRGAVGLIAAYALVLQAFLAYSLATQAAAQNPATFSGTFFVLCTSLDDPDPPRGAGLPVKPKTYCPICTVSASGVAIVPDLVALPLQQTTSVKPTPFVATAACLTFHRARAGLSRAPPLPA